MYVKQTTPVQIILDKGLRNTDKLTLNHHQYDVFLTVIIVQSNQLIIEDKKNSDHETDSSAKKL